MKNGLYYQETEFQGYTYSVDEIMLRFSITDDFLKRVEDGDVPFIKNVSYRIRTGTSYAYNYQLNFSKEAIMNVRLQSKLDANQCYLRCNPNKCFQHEECITIIHFLLSNSSEYHIMQMDIAIDMPYRRNDVSMVKDRRTLITYQSRKDSPGTQYLGRKRSKPGKVKLYDKKQEAHLDFDLTRLELTLANPLSGLWESNLRKWIPKVQLKSNPNAPETDTSRLSSTDRVFVIALPQCSNTFELLHKLDFKKERKLKPFLMVKYEEFKPDDEIMKRVALNVYNTIEVSNAVYCGDTVRIVQPEKENGKE